MIQHDERKKRTKENRKKRKKKKKKEKKKNVQVTINTLTIRILAWVMLGFPQEIVTISIV